MFLHDLYLLLRDTMTADVDAELRSTVGGVVFAWSGRRAVLRRRGQRRPPAGRTRSNSAPDVGYTA